METHKHEPRLKWVQDQTEVEQTFVADIICVLLIVGWYPELGKWKGSLIASKMHSTAEYDTKLAAQLWCEELLEKLIQHDLSMPREQPQKHTSSLCECDTCKIKYLQSDVTEFQNDIRYLQAINGKLCAEVEDLRGRLALARPTKEDEEAMALIRSAARELQTEKPTPDLSEGEGLQPDGSYVIKVRAGESALCGLRRHPNVLRVESGGVVVEPGPPGRVVRIMRSMPLQNR